jgi:hypothetical protein
MNTGNKYQVFLLAAVVAILLAFAFYKRETLPEKTLKWHFKGAVKNVRYDLKKYPWVIIADKEYNLYYTTWDFNVKINRGDTLIKYEGDRRVKLIRAGSHDTVFFEKRKALILK